MNNDLNIKTSIIVKVDLSSFPPEKQTELKKKILAIASDDYIIVGHPEILTVHWEYKDSIESLFPELAPYLTYS